MNAIANTAVVVPQPLLSNAARLAAAVAVAGLVALAWTSAGRASHEAVDTATAALSRNVIHVTLPTVEIVARREPAAITQVAASGIYARNHRSSAL